MRRSLETTFLPPGENEDNLERDSGAGPDIEATGGGGSYVDNYSLTPVKFSGVEIHPAGASDEISPEEVCWRLESEGVVKVAPRLDEQLAGKAEDRSNVITCIAGMNKSLGTDTSNDRYRRYRTDLTESEVLHQLDAFLADIGTLGDLDMSLVADAWYMRENLTFIGEKEYKEAAAGIAGSWVAALEADDDLRIYAVTGEITKLKNVIGKVAYKNQIKSDEYLLNNILANFTEGDWEKYGDKIIVDRDDIAKIPKEHLRVVLLDDWTISGWQLGKVYSSLSGQYPELKDLIEVQLIVANEQRIKHGLEVDWLRNSESIPVKAYFLAHDSIEAEHGAHITGYHSAVDFDFEVTIKNMVGAARELLGADGKDIHMPPGTNIVRPYRKDGVTRDSLVNIERARQCRRRRLAERQGSGYVIL